MYSWLNPLSSLKKSSATHSLTEFAKLVWIGNRVLSNRITAFKYIKSSEIELNESLADPTHSISSYAS